MVKNPEGDVTIAYGHPLLVLRCFFMGPREKQGELKELSMQPPVKYYCC